MYEEGCAIPRMENQKEKTVEHEMGIGCVKGLVETKMRVSQRLSGSI